MNKPATHADPFVIATQKHTKKKHKPATHAVPFVIATQKHCLPHLATGPYGLLRIRIYVCIRGYAYK